MKTDKTNRLIKSALRYVDSWLEYKFQQLDIPAWSVGIRSGKSLLYKKAFGYSNLENKQKLSADHLFRIASHSKMFTAVALMQLKEAGKLEFDYKISKFLPWFRSSKDPTVQTITIRQLLSHTAGIIRDGDDSSFWSLERDFPTLKEFKKYVQNSKSIYQPLERFKYSNFGFATLGLVIEKASGSSYEEYIKRNIFSPLELKYTTVEYEPSISDCLADGYSRDYMRTGRRRFPHCSTEALAAATGFCSNVSDLCRFGAANFYGDPSLISDAGKRELHWEYSRFPTSQTGYGLGFRTRQVGNRPLVGHSGGFPGFITQTMIDPKDKIVVCALTNCIDGPAEQICSGIFSVINFFLNYQPVNAEKKFSKQLLGAEGRYYTDFGVLDLVRIGNSIVRASPDSWFPFEEPGFYAPLSEKTMLVSRHHGFGSEGEVVRIKSVKNGKVTKLLHSGTTFYSWPEFVKLRRERNV